MRYMPGMNVHTVYATTYVLFSTRTSLTITRNTIIARIHFISRSIHHEVTKLATERSEATHLPIDPVEALLALGWIGWDKPAMLLREVLHDRGGLK